MAAMRTMIMLAMLVGCGDDTGTTQTDAPGGQIDAAVDAPPDSSPNPTALDCPSYCGTITTACTGTLAQFSSMQNCLDTCGTWTMGTAGEMTGNTLACRVTHVDLAKTGPDVHCEHAGPAGAGQCGAICDGFCTIVRDKCQTQYPSNGACSAMCGSFTSTPPYKAPSTGNTVQCRLYHATMAASDQVGHCGHTATVSSTCN